MYTVFISNKEEQIAKQKKAELKWPILLILSNLQSAKF